MTTSETPETADAPASDEGAVRAAGRAAKAFVKKHRKAVVGTAVAVVAAVAVALLTASGDPDDDEQDPAEEEFDAPLPDPAPDGPRRRSPVEHR
ncbi:hypothetical protein [Kitasatospora sp. NPDC004531]